MHDIQILKENRRSLSIQILPGGGLVVKAPRFTPDFIIHRFVKSHEGWIEKHKKKLTNTLVKTNHRYTDGEQFLYLGEIHTLTIGKHTKIQAKNLQLLFPEFLTFRIQKEMSDWYQKRSKILITELVKKNAALMNVSYTEIYFSDAKSKWGSCSVDNRLQFNWRLIMAPFLVVNYVVVHELAHTIEKNHSRAFWRKVEQYTPSYRQHIKWLKENGPSLVL